MVSGWILGLGAAVVFIAATYLLDRRGYLPEFLNPYGPTLMVQTERSRILLDKIAKAAPRFWKHWGTGGVIIAFLVLIANMFVVVFSALTVIQNPPNPSGVHHPTNMLIIPGVNDYLPVTVLPEILIALGVGIIIHEAGHGIFCRVADIDIDRVGLLLFTVLPIGAFVEPDKEQEENAGTMERLRMYAAGVTNNFAFAILCFGLLFTVVGSVIVPAPGVAVAQSYPGSPAEQAGIAEGDRITHINGHEVSGLDAAEQVVSASQADAVNMTLNSERTVTVERQVYVVGAVEAVGLQPREKIVAVNGVGIDTEQEFSSVLANASGATVTLLTDADNRVTVPLGVPVKPAPDSPAAEAIPGNSTVFVSHVDGNQVFTKTAFEETVANASGETSFTVYHDGNTTNVTVAPQDGSFGFVAAPGTNGIQTTDVGIKPYPVDTYLGFVQGDFSMNGQLAWYQQVLLLLAIPMASTLGLPFNFPGITGAEANFYDTIPALAGVEPIVFFLANTLFWAGWINTHVGLFNCIPTFMLDGGHMVKTTVEDLLERGEIADADSRLSSAITLAFTAIIFTALMALIFVPLLLG